MTLQKGPIDLLAILQKSLDRAIFLYIFIHEVRSSGVRASITIVHNRKFYGAKYRSILILFRIAKVYWICLWQIKGVRTRMF